MFSRGAEALKFEVGRLDRLDRLVGGLQLGCPRDKHSESCIGLHCDCALTVYMQIRYRRVLEISLVRYLVTADRGGYKMYTNVLAML